MHTTEEQLRPYSMFHEHPAIFTFTRFGKTLYDYTIMTAMDPIKEKPESKFETNIHFVPR